MGYDKRKWKIEKINIGNVAFYLHIYYRRKNKWIKFGSVINYNYAPFIYVCTLKYQKIGADKDPKTRDIAEHFCSRNLEPSLLYALRKLRKRIFKEKPNYDLDTKIEELILKLL